VRTRVGRSDSPDSSTKAISRPCWWAFFSWRRPGALLPARDGRLVALLGPPLGLLAGEAQLAEQTPHTDLAVAHAEAALNGLAHPLQGPQFGAVAGRLGAGQQDAAQLLVLLGIELGGAATLAHDSQGIDAVGFEHAEPAIHGLPQGADRRGDLGRRLAPQQHPSRTRLSFRRFVHRHYAPPRSLGPCASNARAAIRL
jgi:hypothetical protein